VALKCRVYLRNCDWRYLDFDRGSPIVYADKGKTNMTKMGDHGWQGPAEVPRNGDTHSYNTRQRNRVRSVRSRVAVCERWLPERQGLLFVRELPNAISEIMETCKFEGILKSYLIEQAPYCLQNFANNIG